VREVRQDPEAVYVAMCSGCVGECKEMREQKDMVWTTRKLGGSKI
jgi:hypothetical protein